MLGEWLSEGFDREKALQPEAKYFKGPKDQITEAQPEKGESASLCSKAAS